MSTLTDPSTLSAMIRLLPGSGDKVSAWRQTLCERMDEAQASLRAEGVDFESWFDLPTDEGRFMMGLMRMGPGGAKPPPQATTAIDEVHTEMKRSCWDRTHRVSSTLVSDSNLFRGEGPGVIGLCVVTVGKDSEAAACDALRAAKPPPHATCSVFSYGHSERRVLGLFVRAASRDEVHAIEQSQLDALQARGVQVLQWQVATALLDIQAWPKMVYADSADEPVKQRQAV